MFTESALLFNNYISELHERFKRAQKNKTLDISALNLEDKDIIDFCIPFLKNNSDVHMVNANNNRIKFNGVMALVQIPTLTTLLLSGNQFGSEGAKAFENNTTLVKLDISSNFIGDNGVEVFKNNTKLEYLNLSRNSISDKGVKFLKGTHVKELPLTDNDIGNKGAETILNMTPLSKLDMQYNDVSDKQIQASLKKKFGSGCIDYNPQLKICLSV